MKYVKILAASFLILFALSCDLIEHDNNDDGGGEITRQEITNQEYIILAWNDLGMHCLSPRYDTMVILPPYNTIWAQLIRRAEDPQIISQGITLTYRIVDNTYSSGKRAYGQFWNNVFELFGVNLPVNKGLNLSNPNINNGLSGTMITDGDHFIAEGIPVTPVNDQNQWNPYQVAEIVAKDGSGNVLATTRLTVPVSDEINCFKCHDSEMDILEEHDDEEYTNLRNNTPVLCANCHGSPALGRNGRGSSGKYLSEAIHDKHDDVGAACYDCHPGNQTRCSRSSAHTTSDGNCTTCHGSISQVASTIESGARVPWVNEPACSDCHSGIAEVATGATLYRNAKGHGDVYCAGCHGSPHAMFPSNQDSDNYQPEQYQSVAASIGTCGVCHSNSKPDSDEFFEEHGGSSPNVRTACHVCHTSVSGGTSEWPHQFGWKSR